MMMGNRYAYFYAGAGKARWCRSKWRDRREIRRRVREKEREAKLLPWK